jgi:hypothetical protein
MSMGSERRRADRMSVKIPVKLDGGEGVTRDANSTGVYFETDVNCVAYKKIAFSLKFDNPGCPVMVWDCKGRVVRVEQRGATKGVAVQIVEFKLQSGSNSGQSAARAG